MYGLMTSSGYIAATVVMLATGHSARDVYRMLQSRGVPLVPKPFQMGVRIEQPQETVNRVQYGASRLEELHEAGESSARLYGHDPADGVGGDGAFFLLLDEPEVYGLPPDPVVPTRDAPAMWRYAGMAASALVTVAVSAFVGRGRR